MMIHNRSILPSSQQELGNILIQRSAKLSILKPILSLKNIVLIQGKAGQGKTTFALSVAKEYYAKHIYYKITESDRSTEHFCKNLHVLLKKDVPRYSCPEFSEIVDSGRFDPLESDNYIKMILKSLKKVLMQKTVVIIDDAHVLPDIGIACMMILSGLTISGGMLNFIICTRKNCSFPESFSKLDKITHRITDDFLNVSDAEFHELCVKMLAGCLSLSRVEMILRLNEGWIHGVTSSFEYIKQSGSCRLPSPQEITQLFSGFFEGLISDFPPKQVKNLMLLSLLDNFDLQFLYKLDPTEKTAAVIHDMLLKQVFTFISGSSIRFHNLFREWLKTLADSDCTKEEISSVFQTASEYELLRGNIIKSLEYLIKSGNFNGVEQFIKKRFFELMSSDSIKTITNAMMSIPPEALREYPWTGTLFGYFMIFIQPDKTGAVFEHTKSIFEASGDTGGIIISLFGMVFYYCEYSGDLTGGYPHFSKLKELGADREMTPEENLAYNIGMSIGCSYFESDVSAVKHLNAVSSYFTSSTLAPVKILANGIGVRCRIFSSDISIAEKYCDALILKLNTTSISSYQKLYILYSLSLFSSMKGSFDLLGSLLSSMKRKNRLHTESNLKAKALISITEADMAICLGDMQRALDHMKYFSESGLGIPDGHLSSMVMVYQALIKAYTCDESAAEIAETALKLAEQAPGNIYYHVSVVFLAGASYVLSGNFKKAESYLHRAVAMADENGCTTISAGAHVYLSYLNNNVGNRINAREHAVYALRLFQRTGITKVIGFLPEAALNMCCYGVSDQTVAEFAKKLAYDRLSTAFDEESHPIPVLKFTTMDTLTISVAGAVFDCSVISVHFRQMIAILLSVRGYMMEQEVMQTYLWPDSGKEQARRSFDNLLSRFRKMLLDNFPGIDPKKYISLSGGVLRLMNIKCDADEFISLTQSSRDHFKRGEYTASAEALVKAESMFSDRYFIGINGIVEIEQKRREVDAAFISMLTHTQRLGFFLPDIFSPEKFYDKWLDCYMNETDMVSMAYKYYMNEQKPQKAGSIIKDFMRYMKNEGYEDDEINELVYIIKSAT